jgi:CubicO group peptidase (beta-lactamase class C family)
MIIAAVALPASGTSASEGRSSTDLSAIDRFIQRELDAGSIPGAALAITHGDEVVYVRGYGHDSSGEPVSERTLFRIASLSKSFTSLAVMQLVDEGLVALDDTVASHLEEFHTADPRGADITVRQILDQTSGLADREIHDFSRPQPAGLAEATASLSEARLVAAPGSQWNYHNPNYHLAARLVEVVSGESFDDYLRHHVFEPIGMSSSASTTFDDDPVEGLGDGHVMAYGRAFALPGPHILAAGAGGVVSNASDMARWLIIHSNQGRTEDGTRLVSKEGLEELHSASAPGGYALGWDTYGPARSPTRIEHSGNLFTFSAYEAILLDSGYGIALLFNSSSPLLRDQTAMFTGVMKIVEGSDMSPSGAGSSTKTLDLILAVLTGGVLLLGIRAVLRSRRWTTKHVPLRARSVLRLVPYVFVIAVLASFPRIVGSLVGGRDVPWKSAAYGWPALTVFVLLALLATTATLISRAWHLLLYQRGDAALRQTSAETLERPRPGG